MTYAKPLRDESIDPWESWGPLLDHRALARTDDLRILSRYANVARRVGELLAAHSRRERNWTRFRLASAIVQELHSGRRWSTNQRRLASGCHPIDFRSRLNGIYQRVIDEIRAQLPTPPEPESAMCRTQGRDLDMDVLKGARYGLRAVVGEVPGVYGVDPADRDSRGGRMDLLRRP